MNLQDDLILAALKQRRAALQMGLLGFYEEKVQLEKKIEGNRIAIMELHGLIEPFEKKEPDGTPPNLQ